MAMKRRIMFRGRCNGAWRKGDHLTYSNGECIKNWGGGFSFEYDVEPDTVGQFTGFYDVDGERIFEGDICELLEIGSCRFCVEWDITNARFNCFFLKGQRAKFTFNRENASKYFRVIGNIHDNPELLTGSDSK